jgi:hypothetical protein
VRRRRRSAVSRETPEQDLEKVRKDEMVAIGRKLDEIKIPWEVFE